MALYCLHHRAPTDFVAGVALVACRTRSPGWRQLESRAKSSNQLAEQQQQQQSTAVDCAAAAAAEPASCLSTVECGAVEGATVAVEGLAAAAAADVGVVGAGAVVAGAGVVAGEAECR